MFNKTLAQDYLDQRRLLSLPTKLEYMQKHNIAKTDDLHKIMIDTSNEFEAMIKQMIAAE